MKFVVMFKDECGDEHRAYGTEFLSAVHEFPSFDADDDAMVAAFFAWQSNIETRAQAEWEAHFGPECRLFIERLHSDISLSEWYAMGYGD